MASKKGHKRHAKKHAKHAKKHHAHHAKHHSHDVRTLRREYCMARAHADKIGTELGKLTGVHKASRHKKRHTHCRTAR